MMKDITPVVLEDWTTATLEGTGVFDTLMRATKAHLQEEFSRSRIKGPEYAQVYLGSLTEVMEQSLTFLLEKDKASQQAKLINAQILLAEQQAANAIIEGQNLVLQSAILEQQALNLAAERDNMLQQRDLIEQQVLNMKAEALNIPKQGELIDAQVIQAIAQGDKLKAETLNIPKQGKLLDQQTANAVTENDVMLKQICKLQAEYDVLMEQKLKTVAEAGLLTQKRSTEKAQVSSMGVDPDSIIGKQVALYHAQAEGFQRDAEQKAAKLMVDSWNVRRTTDEDTVADSTNMLSDHHIGRTITRLLAGVNA